MIASVQMSRVCSTVTCFPSQLSPVKGPRLQLAEHSLEHVLTAKWGAQAVAQTKMQDEWQPERMHVLLLRPSADYEAASKAAADCGTGSVMSHTAAFRQVL